MNYIEIIFNFKTPSGWEFKRSSPKKPDLGKRILAGWNVKFDSYLVGYSLVKRYHAKEKRRVIITRFAEMKRDFIKDDVNLREGCKPLMDALVRAKLLVDDSIKWLDDRYFQEIGEPRTKVEIIWK